MAQMNATDSFDAIVLGLGGMGSAAAAELARRGRRVLGLEQFPLVHSRGSSHGQTRVIRQAYYEHPDYVPLARRAFERWFELEKATGKKLLTDCGCLNVGTPDSELVTGIRRAAREHSLPVEELSATEIAKRYPAMRFPDDMLGVLEHRAGFLLVEECVRAHCDEAIKHGAELHAEEPVVSWAVDGAGVQVKTAKGTYRADKLVIAAGSWANQLLNDCGLPLRVMRQVQLWFGSSQPQLVTQDRLPMFLAQTPLGHFYGIPSIEPWGQKTARHYGEPELPSPDGVDWTVHDRDETPVREFLREYLPGVDGPRTHAQVCQYTLTPDRHFVIDLHPEYPQVCVAAGFSGHGFKFAPVVGEILADFAERGHTNHKVELFRASRFR